MSSIGKQLQLRGAARTPKSSGHRARNRLGVSPIQVHPVPTWPPLWRPTVGSDTCYFPVTQDGNYSCGLSPGSITVCGVWCLLRLMLTTFHNDLPKERGSPCFWATGLQGLRSPQELPFCPQGRTEPSCSAPLQVARVRSACSAPLQNWPPVSSAHSQMTTSGLDSPNQN